MGYPYQRELDFLQSVLRQMRLQMHLLHPGDSHAGLDLGLRSLLKIDEQDKAAYQIGVHWQLENTVFKIVDPFLCRYLYFHLPASVPPTAVLIGPYLTIDPSSELILEQTERLGLPLDTTSLQADYYASLPIFNDPSPIMALIHALGERLWDNDGNFDMVDVNYEQPRTVLPAEAGAPIEQPSILQQMKVLEERYAYENELMEIIAKGMTNRTEMIMTNISKLNYQQRLADPLRNMKNYCIICNTLMRKAAQQGGVHPLYLDRMSSQYARSIETAPTLDACTHLIGEMIRSYCRMVRTRTGKQYSAIVQKTLTYIDANLSGDLSLSTLARLMEITPGYLSALFRQETGVTLTAHIIAQRMNAALQLLRSTRLQVQNVAQLCGFSDPNYFARQFKRHFGVTPAAARRDHPKTPHHDG